MSPNLIVSLYLFYNLNTFVVFFGTILGCLLVYFFSNLIGKPSQKFGLPFVVLLRSSLGIKGAKYFGFLRFLVGIFMFGIQTYFLSKAYKTKKEFLDAYNAKTGKNLTLKDIEGLDGVKVDNEIMINVEEAAENNAVTVGSHELLHGILNSSFTSKELREITDKNGNIVETDLTVEGEQLIRDFLKQKQKLEGRILSEEEYLLEIVLLT